MRKVRNLLAILLVAGFTIAAACTAVSDDVSAQSLIMSRGCLSGADSTNASVTTGFRTWYADEGTTSVHGLTGPFGMWRYSTVVAFSDNTGNTTVTRYLNGDTVAVDLFGPGGGFADYVVCDSLTITKTASDIVSYKFCW